MLDSLRTSSGPTLRYTYLFVWGGRHFVKVPGFLLARSCVEHHLLSCTSGLNVCKEWKLCIILPTSSFCLGTTIAMQGSGPSHLSLERESLEPTFFCDTFPTFGYQSAFHILSHSLYNFTTHHLPLLFILIAFTYVKVSVCPQKKERKRDFIPSS